MRDFHSGFTLVELLAVSAISSILLGIALPVVQDAREDARRIQCAKQLGVIYVGSAMYEEANGKMPPMTTGPGPFNGGQNSAQHQHTGALAYILPFIGEQELFDLMPEVATQPDVVLGPGTAPIINFANLFWDPGMAMALNEKRTSFICPSYAEYNDIAVDRLFYRVIQDTGAPQVWFIASIPTVTKNETSFGRTSYLPSMGGFHVQAQIQSRAIDISLEDAAGPMRNRTTSIAVADLGDGASNTICWSESLGSINDNIFQTDTHRRGANFALLSSALVTGHSWIIGNDSNGPVRILFGNSEQSLYWLIGSNHPGGNNVTMCDGSNRFVSTGTSRGVMAALGCGNDGWIVPRN